MAAGALARCWVTLAAVVSAADVQSLGDVGAARESSLLQTWGSELNGAGAGVKDTPVTRVVKLLTSMQTTLKKEMEEDEALYDKLACWCNDNQYEKDNAISQAESKIQELEASIESLTAKSAGLKTTIQELETELAADKESLGEATEQREKELKQFHGQEMDSIQAIENLKAALVVLGKHHGGAFPQLALSLLSVRAAGKKGVDEPLSETFESYHMTQPLDEFMRKAGWDTAADDSAAPVVPKRDKFLQQESGALDNDAAPPPTTSWSSADINLVKKAFGAASAFMQAHHSAGYYPSYSAQSGEIMGVLNQLKDEMQESLSESQKQEMARASAFAELRAAKSASIASGEKMAEQKEDELATTDNDLAEAKEDIGQEQAALTEHQKFVINLKKTCKDADANFQARKMARMSEIQAVSETIEILTADNARDAMTGTFSLMQVSSVAHKDRQVRKEAAKLLRQAAAKVHAPMLSVLATTVELDAFTRVKKAIDDMVSMLKVQQSDEVKKNDWCKAELHENEMVTARTTDHKADLEAKVAQDGQSIQSLEEGIADATGQIAALQVDLQRATEDRKNENLDFQKTVADQMAVIGVLKQALDKLATYYDKESFVQVRKQTPPVPQMEYKPSKGAGGVMEMIEKLIQDAQTLKADATKAEREAQAAYEAVVANTNDSVAALQKEVTTKSKAKAKATKSKLQAESDLADTNTELEGLGKYNGELHGECDYVLENFMARQEARQQEIEALQQAKQILSGASAGF